MTADIKHTLDLLWSLWEDLPKAKSDLVRYGDNELGMLEALCDGATMLRERCLEAQGERPSLKISGQVQPELLREAVKQASRDRN
jgi:hypothetical protein